MDRQVSQISFTAANVNDVESLLGLLGARHVPAPTRVKMEEYAKKKIQEKATFAFVRQDLAGNLVRR